MSDVIREAESILSSLPRFADDPSAYSPGLERIERLLTLMGNPHVGMPCVHVAGTNGKGSTASFIAAIGSACGRRIGLHTSPHLFHVSERMRVDGSPAAREWLARAVVAHRDGVDDVGPSYFELTVALSLLYFAESEVDLSVVEVGMGGRLDATNILTPLLSVVTDVGLDHVQHLGDSVQAIAREKAGIVKPDVPVLTGARTEASSVIREIAMSLGVPFHDVSEEVRITASSCELRGSSVTIETPVRTYVDLYVGLAGEHQIRNAACAIRASELVLEEVQADHRGVFEGIRHVRELTGLRGRLEVLRDDPLIVADVGHNEDGLASAVAHLRQRRRLAGRFVVLLGVMRDKDVDGMSRVLAGTGAVVQPVKMSSTRALSPRELADRLEVCEVETAEPCTVEEGIKAFLSDASHDDTLLITGSHQVVCQLKDAAI